MRNDRCDFCNCRAEHETYKLDKPELEYMRVCEYHYWKLRPDRRRDSQWPFYRYIHPVRVARWRRLDPEFDAMISSQLPYRPP